MDGRLAGRTALVFGAARGIGAAIAARFIEEGASVTISDTLRSEGEETAADIGARFVSADVSDPAEVEAAVAASLDIAGGLDILVQNAGVYPWTLIENTTPEEWDRVLDLAPRSRTRG